MQISIVIPLYNEDESLPELVAWIHRVMTEHSFSYEVILIDDGSTDTSWKVIQELKQTYAALKGIRFRTNYGKSAALHVGFEAAEGEVVVTMDADMQDSPDEVPELYRMVMEDGFDLVSGYKQKRYDPLSKTIPTKIFNAVTRWVSGINNLHDFNCGLKAYRKSVIKNIEIFGEMHRHIPVLAKWAGYGKIGEKVVQHRARKYGVTKFGLSRFINGFLDLFTLLLTQKYAKRPMHFFGAWGVLFGVIGGGTMFYLAFIKLILGQILSERVPALMFGMSFLLVGMLLFSTGLLAELIARNSPYKNQYGISERID